MSTLAELPDGTTRVHFSSRINHYSGPESDDWAVDLRALNHLVCGGATCNDFLRHATFMHHGAILGYEWRPISPMMRVAGSDDEAMRRVEYYMIVPSDIAALVKLGDSEPGHFVVQTRNDLI